jgi:hypothetical protein
VICGLVDRSVLSNVSYKMAVDHGLETRRLPVQENVASYQKLAFNIDIVAKILAAYCETSCWKTAIVRHAAVRHLIPYDYSCSKQKSPRLSNRPK